MKTKLSVKLLSKAKSLSEVEDTTPRSPKMPQIAKGGGYQTLTSYDILQHFPVPKSTNNPLAAAFERKLAFEMVTEKGSKEPALKTNMAPVSSTA